jgi:hypothetical protein
MKHSESIAAIAEAFAAAQAEYVPVQKKKTATVKGTSKNGKDYDYTYQYADLADILEMAIPRLSKQGLAFSQPHCMVDGKLRVVSYLLHKSGEWMHSDGIEISELSPDPQQLGIESTYFRRYDGSSFLGIAPDEDTDGQSTGDRTRRKGEENQDKPLKLCPLCGKDAIVKGKEEFGGGWLCYKAKGGCGAKFDKDPTDAISHQPATPPATAQTTQPPAQRAAPPPAASQRSAQLVKRAGKNLVFTVAAVKLWPEKGVKGEPGYLNASMNVAFTGKLVAPNGSWTCELATCWHPSLFNLLQSSLGKLIEIFVTERDKDGRHFVDINDVVSITDEQGEFVEYQDGKPVPTGAQ